MKHMPPESSGPLTVIGWRETISLPELKLHDFAVKVDTGAKTTALHADAIETFQKDGANWVRFQSPELGDVPVHVCEFPILALRRITNTSGMPEARIVIRTPIELAAQRWEIDISLTNRANMRFPLILGRRALRGRNIGVHPAKSYLVSNKPHSEGSKR